MKLLCVGLIFVISSSHFQYILRPSTRTSTPAHKLYIYVYIVIKVVMVHRELLNIVTTGVVHKEVCNLFCIFINVFHAGLGCCDQAS